MTAPIEKPAGTTATSPEKPRRGLFERLTGPRLSPHGLLSCAAVLVLLFAIMHLAGLREYTTIISGTSPTGDLRDQSALSMGVLYIILYMVATMIVPVLAIAAGLLAIGFALPAGTRNEEEAQAD